MRINLGLLAAVCGLMAVSASRARASIDIIESVPIETNLAVPGIQDTQSAWLELISSARQTIDLEEFYISGGTSLQPVLAALKTAASRGVKIRIILDSQFYKTYPNDANALAHTANVQVKTIDFSKRGGIMHAKYFVVDQSRAYVGSANFDWLALSHIHEIGLKINDPRMGAGIESIFNLDWKSGVQQGAKTFIENLTEDFSGSVLQLYASPTRDLPAGVPPTLDAIIKLMNSARSSIKIQMYEYATSIYGSSVRFRNLDNAIRAAAARGVKVQMLVDKTATKAGGTDLSLLAKVRNVELKVISIPQWSGGVLQYARVAHSKYMIVDDASVWIGSENWSGDYFTSSRNVGLIANDPAALAKIEQVFARVWSSNYVKPE